MARPHTMRARSVVRRNTYNTNCGRGGSRGGAGPYTWARRYTYTYTTRVRGTEEATRRRMFGLFSAPPTAAPVSDHASEERARGCVRARTRLAATKEAYQLCGLFVVRTHE